MHSFEVCNIENTLPRAQTAFCMHQTGAQLCPVVGHVTNGQRKLTEN